MSSGLRESVWRSLNPEVSVQGHVLQNSYAKHWQAREMENVKNYLRVKRLAKGIFFPNYPELRASSVFNPWIPLDFKLTSRVLQPALPEWLDFTRRL